MESGNKNQVQYSLSHFWFQKSVITKLEKLFLGATYNVSIWSKCWLLLHLLNHSRHICNSDLKRKSTSLKWLIYIHLWLVCSNTTLEECCLNSKRDNQPDNRLLWSALTFTLVTHNNYPLFVYNKIIILLAAERMEISQKWKSLGWFVDRYLRESSMVSCAW